MSIQILENNLYEKSIDVVDVQHGHRVAELAIKIGKKISLDMREIKDLYIAGIFHDIGKALIDQEILHKPGKLTNYEYLQIQKHVKFGAILGVKMKLSRASVQDILAHHESYDGSGYPKKLKGEEIPLGGRILKICDVYDALCMKRPYREAYSQIQVKNIMEKEKHTFDPKLYDIFWEVGK